MLISLGTVTRNWLPVCLIYFGMLIASTRLSRIPLGAFLRNAAVVLPFALCFAAITAVSGEYEKAILLLVRSWLSVQVALLLVATTPMPRLIAGFETLHAPRYLLQVIQFLYRYLAVLTGEAQAMIEGGAARAGSLRTLRLRQAAAMAGVLFARSHERAKAIHHAMVSRGFEGRFPDFRRLAFRPADAVFGIGALVAIVAVRAAVQWA